MVVVEVTLPADDRALVSLEAAKAALGITGSDSDDAVRTAVLRASDLISRQCGLDMVGSEPPSLRPEDLVETFRGEYGPSLMLSRRFVKAVYMITDNGTQLGADDYAVQGRMVKRLRGDAESCWSGGKVVVEYAAGFDDVPEDLQQACLDTVREQWSGASRDPLLRSETVEGVGRLDYQVGGLARDSGQALAPAVLAAIKTYRVQAL